MRKEGDVTLIDTLTLECLQLKMSPRFDLRKEDPQVYLNEDREGYNPKRQWPKVPLPTTTAPSADPAPATDPEKLKKGPGCSPPGSGLAHQPGCGSLQRLC